MALDSEVEVPSFVGAVSLGFLYKLEKPKDGLVKILSLGDTVVEVDSVGLFMDVAHD